MISPKIRNLLRWCSRIIFLVLFLLFMLAGELPFWLRKILGNVPKADGEFVPPLNLWQSFLKGILPETSGFNLLAIALTGTILGMVSLFAVLIIILSFWKGRLFCMYVCPLGTCLELQGKFLPSAKKRVSLNWNGLIFWTTVCAAILGIPVFLFLDPLSSFNRLGLLLNPPFPLAALLPMSLLLVIFLLGFIKPMFWCADLCPLGYFYVMLGKVRSMFKKKKEKSGEEPVSRTRRELLAGLAIGIPAVVLLRSVPFAARGKNIPVLPPGAGTPDRFHFTCSRCYACVNVCPNKVIQVKMPSLDDAPESCFAPRMSMDHAYCADDCNLCTQVCPTKAIKPLDMDTKKCVQIGIAEVDHSTCLAWAHGEHCLICEEYCSYAAFDSIVDENGIPCPVVSKDRCRGCGICQSACPVRPVRAIRVKGVFEQRQLDPIEEYW